MRKAEEASDFACLSEPPVTPNTTFGYCPDGYKDVIQGTPYCYKVVPDQLQWGSADSECAKDGAKLASIHSQVEMNYIHREVQLKNKNVWIGLALNCKAFGTHLVN